VSYKTFASTGIRITDMLTNTPQGLLSDFITTRVTLSKILVADSSCLLQTIIYYFGWIFCCGTFIESLF